MKISVNLREEIIASVIAGLLVFLIISVLSTIKTGNWLKWFYLIPNIIWLISGLIIFSWVVIILVHKRIKKLKRPSAVVFGIPSPPAFGWRDIGKINYAGVVWKIREPAPDPFGSLIPYRRGSPLKIDVETPPRCPNCETELEELESFWGGYIWKCVRCGFRKRSRDSFYREAERVEKLAKS